MTLLGSVVVQGNVGVELQNVFLQLALLHLDETKRIKMQSHIYFSQPCLKNRLLSFTAEEEALVYSMLIHWGAVGVALQYVSSKSSINKSGKTRTWFSGWGCVGGEEVLAEVSAQLARGYCICHSGTFHTCWENGCGCFPVSSASTLSLYPACCVSEIHTNESSSCMVGGGKVFQKKIRQWLCSTLMVGVFCCCCCWTARYFFIFVLLKRKWNCSPRHDWWMSWVNCSHRANCRCSLWEKTMKQWRSITAN